MTRAERMALGDRVFYAERCLDRIDVALAARAASALTELQRELWLEVQVLGRPASQVAAGRGVSKVAVSKTVRSAGRRLQAARLKALAASQERVAA